jgi:hypothetical protein
MISIYKILQKINRKTEKLIKIKNPQILNKNIFKSQFNLVRQVNLIVMDYLKLLDISLSEKFYWQTARQLKKIISHTFSNYQLYL